MTDGLLHDANGLVDFLVYKSLGGMKPCFLGAFDLDGEPMWSVGDPRLTVADADGDDLLRTTSPDRPGPVAICDLDGDGDLDAVTAEDDKPMVVRQGSVVLAGMPDGVTHLALAYPGSDDYAPDGAMAERVLGPNLTVSFQV
ncbi:MAG: hypothetical protein QF473_40975, partial [Planctomycetota bacterium]|nr:hypothetical protein [Planctomycetota bacterium]